MVNEYLRPQTIREALDAKAKREDSRYLAGGTYLLAGDYRQKPAMVIDIGALLPTDISFGRERVIIGAGANFEDLLETVSRLSSDRQNGSAYAVASLLESAALAMANRNVRNRATVGGNIAGRKSAASLIPALLALDSRLELALPSAGGGTSGGEKLAVPLADWLKKPEGIIMNVEIPVPAASGFAAAYLRYARTSCDISILNAAVAFVEQSGRLANVHIALGGVSALPERLASLEAQLEGRALPEKAAIESLAAPLLDPIGDQRGSAGFKRLRASALIADALYKARMGGDANPLGIDAALAGIGRRA